MAQHPIINPSAEMLPLRIASKALDTAKSMQTRKSASAYYTDIDGNGIIIGSNSTDGINRYDPLTGEQSPMWDGVSQDELNCKADEILAAAKDDTQQQITIVNKAIDEAQKSIESNREGLETEAYMRAEGDKAAQEAAQTVKEETEKLKGDYKNMSTDVANVKSDIVDLATQTGNLAETTIVGSIVEYAAGTDTTAPTTGWSTSTPSLSTGQRAWMRTSVTYGDGHTETSNPVIVTGAAGKDGSPGVQGSDGKTYYTYFAYGTNAAGANFSTTPTASSTYMGVCTTTDTTQPTTASRYEWSLTKGNTGAPGTQGVSVTAIVPYYALATNKPAQPTGKEPDGVWSTTEPGYVQGRNLYTCSRIDYSNSQWSWTNVQLSSTYGLASVALMTANGKNKRFVQAAKPTDTDLTQGDEWWQTSTKPLETYWTGEPNNSPSVLVDHSNDVDYVWVWNGSRWNQQLLAAQNLLIAGSVSADLVSGDFFDGRIFRGGTFITTNEKLQLNDKGLILLGTDGKETVTMLSETGAATFRKVTVTDSDFTSPRINGGTVTGAEYRLVTKTGDLVAEINLDGIKFGDSLTYAKTDGKWTLSLKGPIQSGGDVSGATITAPIIQTTRDENRGIKLTSGGLIGYDANKNAKFVLDTNGNITLNGAILSNGSVTGATLQTYPEDKKGVKIRGHLLVAYNSSGEAMLSLDGQTGEAMLTGGMRTAYDGPRLEIKNDLYSYSGTNVSQGTVKGYDQYGEAWHIIGASTRKSATSLDYHVNLYIGINPQQPEIQVMRDFKNSYTSLNLMADRLNIVGSQKTGMPYPAGVYVNNHRIDNLPDMYCGSTVITPSGSSNRHTLFDQAKWKEITGLDDMAIRQPVVLVSNGDIGANNVGMAGAGYSATDKRWYVYLTAATNKVFRVNYCIIISQ